MPALAGLIGQAAKHSQIIVVSHASRLISALEQERDCNSLQLAEEFGETKGALDLPPWYWPPR